jgi:site-specific recombinase XerC
MDSSARVPTLNDLKEKVIFWAVQVRMTEKAIRDATAESVSAAKRRHYHAKMKLNEVTDIYQGKLR